MIWWHWINFSTKVVIWWHWINCSTKVVYMHMSNKILKSNLDYHTVIIEYLRCKFIDSIKLSSRKTIMTLNSKLFESPLTRNFCSTRKQNHRRLQNQWNQYIFTQDTYIQSSHVKIVDKQVDRKIYIHTQTKLRNSKRKYKAAKMTVTHRNNNTTYDNSFPIWC